MNRLIVLVVSITVLNCVLSHENDFLRKEHLHQNNEDNGEQKPIWNYYGKAEIDLEHVLEEAKNVAKLREDKKISQHEAAFYYHKLHDFNSDGYLDGLELLHASKHSYPVANKTGSDDLENYAEVVDIQLQYFDFDGNGFVDFGELAKYINDNTKAT